MSYCTLANFKASVGILSTDTTSDTALQAVLDTTDQLINLYCDRRIGFGQTASQTRYYTATNPAYVLIDDAVSISSLATDDGGDNTYSTAWVLNTDYTREPRNAPLDSWPYTELDTTTLGTKSFPLEFNAVRVIGVFGWPATPASIVQAATIQAAAVWASRTSPFGVIGSAELGGLLRQSRSLHPEAALLLAPFRKLEGLAR